MKINMVLKNAGGEELYIEQLSNEYAFDFSDESL